ncbi:response regulator [Dictyobacter vulcani]|uniref:Response regulator n=1 Tax=Dictyobacter vulcani TaxID=2607529 RepID=A0A5J4KZ26_9CHLR|nr:response regulator [Dictyobacter vulcani]GER91790.1 response regulator [Dictyobacter vulcani]
MSQHNTKHTILVAEDSEEDFITLTRLFKKSAMPYRLFRCSRGEEILDFLYQRNGYAAPGTSMTPSLILLDLNLIGLDGRVVLSRIKSDPCLKHIPVVIITTSSSAREIERCYQEGASGYLLKPVNLDHYAAALNNLLKYWFETVQLPEAKV